MKRKIMTLTLAMVLVLVTATASWAMDFQGKSGYHAVFTGNKITENFTDRALTEDMENVQPGDSIHVKVKVTNKWKGSTDWYMTNEIVRTLEEGARASDAGYEYTLTVNAPSGKKTIFDSKTVGGDRSKGLKSIGKALEKYFYLGRLEKNQSATVELALKVDGETAINSYQATVGKLRMNFGVEKAKPGQKIIKKKIVNKKKIRHTTVKTGDTTPVLLYSGLALGAGLALLVVVAIRRRRQEEGGAQA